MRGCHAKHAVALFGDAINFLTVWSRRHLFREPAPTASAGFQNDAPILQHKLKGGSNKLYVVALDI